MRIVSRFHFVQGRPRATVLAVASFAAYTPTQSLNELRDEFRENLRSVKIVQSLMGLVMAADELELSGARYRIDDDTSTDVVIVALPWHTDVDAFGADAPRLHLEGVVGYGEVRQGVADVFNGTSPPLAASIDTTWRTYGGLLGAGLALPAGNGMTVTPIVDVGLSRIENDTDYAGPGAAALAALADGIAFNWEAMAVSYGPAVRIDWKHALGEGHRLEVVGRYDLRWYDTFAADDPAQVAHTRQQIATLRGDLTGPTGMTLFGDALDWRATLGYRHVVEGDLFDVRGYTTVGASLLLKTGTDLPFGRGIELGAAASVADDFFGWTVGVSVSF